MEVRVISRHPPWFLLVVMALLLANCGDYTIALGDGYRLMRSSGGGRFVLVAPETDGSEILAGPSVRGYREVGDLIIGRVAVVDEQRDPAMPGFFIVDKRTGAVEEGLDARKWHDRLKQYGITSVPELLTPNRIRAWF